MKIAELSLPGFDPLAFFSKLRSAERCPAYFTSGEWTIVTWNPTRSIRAKDEKIFEALQKANQRRRSTYKGNLPFIGGEIGYLDYDAEKKGGIFHEYDQALLCNGKKVIAVGNKKFVEEVHKIHNRVPPSPQPQREKGLGDEDRWESSITHADYARAFGAIQKDIRNGEYYQLNLTYALEADFRGDRKQLFCDLLRTNPASCASYFEDGELAILSLSPERFVTIENGRIVTCPIKGTRPRGKTAAEDARLRNELLRSEKEEAELNMITDLIRNDIGKVSQTGSVNVLAHRKLQKNPTVWHTYSVIEGNLLPTLHPVKALQSMFPGGSVTGCPKAVAIERIAELEKRPRGPYCGSMVMLSDAGYVDSTILIRTIVANGDHLSLGIGGGIVADSVLEDEWQETKQKAKAFEGIGLGMRAGVRIWINGKEISADDPRSALLNPSNPDAYGVFETMRVENGIAFDLEEHLRRLKNSAKILGMKLPQSILTISAWIHRISKPSSPPSPRLRRTSLTQTLPSRLKIVCTPDDVLIEMRPLMINTKEKTGIAATFVNCVRALPEGKILPYHREWKAHEEARAKGYDEALLVDRSGHVPEAAYANIFWVDDGILCTAKSGMLPGITRRHVLFFAKKMNIPVRFSLLTKADLLRADEVFLTKSTTGITPVISIEKTLIGSGKIGITTGKLMHAFESSRHVSATLPPA